MKFIDVFRRANSAWAYWSYSRSIGNPFTVRQAIAEWFRRAWFEFRNNYATERKP